MAEIKQRKRSKCQIFALNYRFFSSLASHKRAFKGNLNKALTPIEFHTDFTLLLDSTKSTCRLNCYSDDAFRVKVHSSKRGSVAKLFENLRGRFSDINRCEGNFSFSWDAIEKETACFSRLMVRTFTPDERAIFKAILFILTFVYDKKSFSKSSQVKARNPRNISIKILIWVLYEFHIKWW